MIRKVRVAEVALQEQHAIAEELIELCRQSTSDDAEGRKTNDQLQQFLAVNCKNVEEQAQVLLHHFLKNPEISLAQKEKFLAHGIAHIQLMKLYNLVKVELQRYHNQVDDTLNKSQQWLLEAINKDIVKIMLNTSIDNLEKANFIRHFNKDGQIRLFKTLFLPVLFKRVPNDQKSAQLIHHLDCCIPLMNAFDQETLTAQLLEIYSSYDSVCDAKFFNHLYQTVAKKLKKPKVLANFFSRIDVQPLLQRKELKSIMLILIKIRHRELVNKIFENADEQQQKAILEYIFAKFFHATFLTYLSSGSNKAIEDHFFKLYQQKLAELKKSSNKNDPSFIISAINALLDYSYVQDNNCLNLALRFYRAIKTDSLKRSLFSGIDDLACLDSKNALLLLSHLTVEEQTTIIKLLGDNTTNLACNINFHDKIEYDRANQSIIAILKNFANFKKDSVKKQLISAFWLNYLKLESIDNSNDENIQIALAIDILEQLPAATQKALLAATSQSAINAIFRSMIRNKNDYSFLFFANLANTQQRDGIISMLQTRTGPESTLEFLIAFHEYCIKENIMGSYRADLEHHFKYLLLDNHPLWLHIIANEPLLLNLLSAEILTDPAQGLDIAKYLSDNDETGGITRLFNALRIRELVALCQANPAKAAAIFATTLEIDIIFDLFTDKKTKFAEQRALFLALELNSQAKLLIMLITHNNKHHALAVKLVNSITDIEARMDRLCLALSEVEYNEYTENAKLKTIAEFTRHYLSQHHIDNDEATQIAEFYKASLSYSASNSVLELIVDNLVFTADKHSLNKAVAIIKALAKSEAESAMQASYLFLSAVLLNPQNDIESKLNFLHKCATDSYTRKVCVNFFDNLLENDTATDNRSNIILLANSKLDFIWNMLKRENQLKFLKKAHQLPIQTLPMQAIKARFKQLDNVEDCCNFLFELITKGNYQLAKDYFSSLDDADEALNLEKNYRLQISIVLAFDKKEFLKSLLLAVGKLETNADIERFVRIFKERLSTPVKDKFERRSRRALVMRILTILLDINDDNMLKKLIATAAAKASLTRIDFLKALETDQALLEQLKERCALANSVATVVSTADICQLISEPTTSAELINVLYAALKHKQKTVELLLYLLKDERVVQFEFAAPGSEDNQAIQSGEELLQPKLKTSQGIVVILNYLFQEQPKLITMITALFKHDEFDEFHAIIEKRLFLLLMAYYDQNEVKDIIAKLSLEIAMTLLEQLRLHCPTAKLTEHDDAFITNNQYERELSDLLLDLQTIEQKKHTLQMMTENEYSIITTNKNGHRHSDLLLDLQTKEQQKNILLERHKKILLMMDKKLFLYSLGRIMKELNKEHAKKTIARLAYVFICKTENSSPDKASFVLVYRIFYYFINSLNNQKPEYLKLCISILEKTKMNLEFVKFLFKYQEETLSIAKFLQEAKLFENLGSSSEFIDYFVNSASLNEAEIMFNQLNDAQKEKVLLALFARDQDAVGKDEDIRSKLEAMLQTLTPDTAATIFNSIFQRDQGPSLKIAMIKSLPTFYDTELFNQLFANLKAIEDHRLPIHIVEDQTTPEDASIIFRLLNSHDKAYALSALFSIRYQFLSNQASSEEASKNAERKLETLLAELKLDELVSIFDFIFENASDVNFKIFIIKSLHAYYGTDNFRTLFSKINNQHKAEALLSLCKLDDQLTIKRANQAVLKSTEQLLEIDNSDEIQQESSSDIQITIGPKLESLLADILPANELDIDLLAPLSKIITIIFNQAIPENLKEKIVLLLHRQLAEEQLEALILGLDTTAAWKFHEIAVKYQLIPEKSTIASKLEQQQLHTRSIILTSYDEKSDSSEAEGSDDDDPLLHMPENFKGFTQIRVRDEGRVTFSDDVIEAMNVSKRSNLKERLKKVRASVGLSMHSIFKKKPSQNDEVVYIVTSEDDYRHDMS